MGATPNNVYHENVVKKVFSSGLQRVGLSFAKTIVERAHLQQLGKEVGKDVFYLVRQLLTVICERHRVNKAMHTSCCNYANIVSY